MLYAYRDGLTSSLVKWIHYVSFSYLIDLVNTCSRMLNRSIKEGTFLSAGIYGKRIQSLIIKHHDSCRQFIGALYEVEEVPISSQFVACFSHESILYFFQIIFLRNWNKHVDFGIFLFYCYRISYSLIFLDAKPTFIPVINTIW